MARGHPPTSGSLAAPRIRLQVALLGALLALSVGQSSCLITRSLVGEARGEFPKSARITAIRGAARDGQDVLVHVAVRSHRRDADPQVLLRVPVSTIGTYARVSDAADFESGDLKLDQPPVGCFEATGTLPTGAQPMPVEQITIRDYGEFERAIGTLSEGAHVLAVRFDANMEVSGMTYSSAESAVFDKNMTMALVVRNSDGSARKQLIWGFDEKSRKRGALLLLTPLAVVGDIVTLPLQIVAGLLIGC